MSTTTRPWSDEEDQRLLSLAAKHYRRHDLVAEALGRTQKSVNNRLYLLRKGGDVVGNYRARDARCTWTPDQDSLLLLHYGSMGPDELAALVGKSTSSLRNRISRLRQGQTRDTVIQLPNMRHDTLAGDRTRQQKATIQQLLTRDH